MVKCIKNKAASTLAKNSNIAVSFTLCYIGFSLVHVNTYSMHENVPCLFYPMQCIGNIYCITLVIPSSDIPVFHLLADLLLFTV